MATPSSVISSTEKAFNDVTLTLSNLAKSLNDIDASIAAEMANTPPNTDALSKLQAQKKALQAEQSKQAFLWQGLKQAVESEKQAQEEAKAEAKKIAIAKAPPKPEPTIEKVVAPVSKKVEVAVTKDISPSPAPALTLTKKVTANKEDKVNLKEQANNEVIAKTSITESGGIIYTPTDNILHEYASYSYSLSLHAIPIKQYNELVKASTQQGAAYTPTNVLMSSGGRRDKTTFNRNKNFNADFFIDDLKMKTIIGASNQTRMTNAISLSFKITEPYGMTLLNRIAKMSFELGCPNFVELPYMLQIDFFGSKGQYADPEKHSLIKNITKYIPIKLIKLEISASSKGAEYDVSAVPFNHQGYADSIVTLPLQVEISAKTISDFFNSDGAEALSGAIRNAESATAAIQTAAKAQSDLERYDAGIDKINQKFAKADIREPINDVRRKELLSNKKAADELVSNTEGDRVVKAHSIANAYNAWLINLADSGVQDTHDQVLFVVDEEIGNSIITPEAVKALSQGKMTPPQETSGDAKAQSKAKEKAQDEERAKRAKIKLKEDAQTQNREILLDAAKREKMGTIERAAFMSQCHVESNGFLSMHEIWGPSYQQRRYEPQSGDPQIVVPIRAGQSDLAKRLGNTQLGDGKKFMGRGFIQLTGRDNYASMSKDPEINQDLVANPDLAAQPEIAAKIAIRFWKTKSAKVNGVSKTVQEWAKLGDITSVTLGINGGSTALRERQALFSLYLAEYSKEDNVQTDEINNAIEANKPSASGQLKFQAANADPSNMGAYPFNAGKSLVDVIGEMVRSSEYIRDQFTAPEYKEIPITADPSKLAEQKCKDGVPLKWYKITSDVILGEWDNSRNQFSKTIIYHITTQEIHNQEHPEAPISKPKGVVKEYHYIFTGKNKDIINFDLKFDCLYFTAKTAIPGNSTRTNVSVKGQPASKADSTAAKEALNGKCRDPSNPAPTDMQPKVAHIANAAGQQNVDADEKSKYIGDLSRTLLSDGTAQLIKVNLKIIGDPDFVKQDDLFYSAGYLRQLKYTNNDAFKIQKTSNGSLLMDNGQIHVNIHFQTASDYNEDGLAVPTSEFSTTTFSGVYRVISVENEFSHGKFEQSLSLVRLSLQPDAAGPGNTSFDIVKRAPPKTSHTSVTAPGVNIPPPPAVPRLDIPAPPPIVKETTPIDIKKQQVEEKITDIAATTTISRPKEDDAISSSYNGTSGSKTTIYATQSLVYYDDEGVYHPEGIPRKT